MKYHNKYLMIIEKVPDLNHLYKPRHIGRGLWEGTKAVELYYQFWQLTPIW